MNKTPKTISSPELLKVAVIAVVLTLALSACGQKGGLYLPNKTKATYSGEPK
ncbi:MAG: lipoprotein [Pseudomonadota bacterium]